MKKLPSQKFLNEMFAYDELTGDLWKRPFTDAIGRRQTRYSKRPCRNILKNHGGKSYYRTKITGVPGEFLVHRIIYKIVTGADPVEVDHISGNGLDNRWVNLRHCNHSENHQNRKRSSRNSSGVVGVSLTRDKKRWRARIRYKGSDILLGEYADFNKAVAVRMQAEKDYGYHPNHGDDRPL